MCINCYRRNVYRLRVDNTRFVYMEWHRYFGPSFWRDRLCTREIELWYEDEGICKALEWFQARGNKA